MSPPSLRGSSDDDMLNLSVAASLHYPYHIAQQTDLIYEASVFCHILLIFDLLFHVCALNQAMIHAIMEPSSRVKERGCPHD
jgi:hypothetical protein